MRLELTHEQNKTKTSPPFQESRIHILINNASVMWHPLERTAEGHELHWGVNHLAAFVMTQLLMPLLYRGAPDARIITVTSSSFKYGKQSATDIDIVPHTELCNTSYVLCVLQLIHHYLLVHTRLAPHSYIGPVASNFSLTVGVISWDDPNYTTKRYRACEAHNQSRLANVLFTRELARRLDGTGVNT